MCHKLWEPVQTQETFDLIITTLPARKRHLSSFGLDHSLTGKDITPAWTNGQRQKLNYMLCPVIIKSLMNRQRTLCNKLVSELKLAALFAEREFKVKAIVRDF